MSSAQIQQFAEDYFNANFHNTEVNNLVLNASYTATGPSVTISATGKLPTDFMGVLGKEYVPLGRSSTTVWGEARLRVALALDNTGSMSSSGKMTALKNATNNLLDQLKGAAAVDGDVYVSIIPFVKDVNVDGIDGTNQTYKANWIKWDGNASKDADLWDKWNGTLQLLLQQLVAAAAGAAGAGTAIPATTTTRQVARTPATAGIPRRTAPGTVASWTVTRATTRSTRTRRRPTCQHSSRPRSTAPARRR